MRAELLIDAADGRQPPDREDARAILEAGRALLILLDDKQSGEHVCSVLETLTGLLRDLLGDRVHLDVVLDYSCRVPLSSDELASALINLVLNARDAIDGDGRVLVQATCVTATDDIARRLEIASGTYMCLEVADDGAGMDSATAARVFDPFFTTKGTRGSGLGLYGVKRRVDRVGGTVVCDSEPGKGTRAPGGLRLVRLGRDQNHVTAGPRVFFARTMPASAAPPSSVFIRLSMLSDRPRYTRMSW